MQPLYFNPLVNQENFIGTNPLGTAGVPIKTTIYPYFNPSIYQSFTFYSFPAQPFYSTALVGASPVFAQTLYPEKYKSSVIGGVIDGFYVYSTMAFYSFVTVNLTQFSTFNTLYADSSQLQPVTYSVRFGTQEQPIYASIPQGVESWNTYELYFSEQFVYYSYVVVTWLLDVFDYLWLGDNAISGLNSALTASAFLYENTIPGDSQQLSDVTVLVGSSSFVNIMGSNVYTGLIDATNSIIIYQNEQVSSYYSQSLSYQVNIANLTAALNSVSSGSGSQESGNGNITVTTFSWNWYTTAQGYTGSQVVDSSIYNVMVVNVYLSLNYGGTVITNSSVAVTQIQSLITVQNNDLANSQTFMNNAVTTLQSQVSLAGQIIGTLSSIMQTIITNI
jgi:hypothetical protein